MRGNNLRKFMLAASKAAGLMPNYPSDFTICACQAGVYGTVPSASVVRGSDTERICATCGTTWEGDRKRHRHIAPVATRGGIGGARGPGHG